MDREAVNNELKNADFSGVQSEMLSHIIADLSTKDDIRALRTEMHGEFRSMRTEVQLLKAELVAVIETTAAELRTEVAESARDTMKTIVALQNSLFRLVLALIAALATLFTLLDIFID